MKRTVDDSTVMSVHAAVKYKKSVWGVIKGFIEKNTWLGLEEFYESLSKALMTEYNLPPAKSKSRRTRKGSAQPQATSSLQQALPAKHHEGAVMNPSMPVKHKRERHVRPEAEGASRDKRQEIMSWIVVLLLIALIAFNVILYVKLWKIDEVQHEDFDFSFNKLEFLR